MEGSSDERGVQAVVFALVAATFLTVYITQPVLPILRAEFGVTPGVASLLLVCPIAPVYPLHLLNKQ